MEYYKYLKIIGPMGEIKKTIAPKNDEFVQIKSNYDLPLKQCIVSEKY